jgi:hypothetical protein
VEKIVSWAKHLVNDEKKAATVDVDKDGLPESNPGLPPPLPSPPIPPPLLPPLLFPPLALTTSMEPSLRLLFGRAGVGGYPALGMRVLESACVGEGRGGGVECLMSVPRVGGCCT